jgi:hypothetical protein
MCACRLSTRSRLLSSVVVFIGGVLAVSWLVDSNMYGGPVSTGEDYYYSWGGYSVTINIKFGRNGINLISA